MPVPDRDSEGEQFLATEGQLCRDAASSGAVPFRGGEPIRCALEGPVPVPWRLEVWRMQQSQKGCGVLPLTFPSLLPLSASSVWGSSPSRREGLYLGEVPMFRGLRARMRCLGGRSRDSQGSPAAFLVRLGD